MKYVAPECGKDGFTCPNCGAYAQQRNWAYREDATGPYNNSSGQYPLAVSRCVHCGDLTIWHYQDMVYPHRGSAPMPNKDMPPEVLKDYEEAAAILTKSPRGASALLRLGIQKLCVHLGGAGKNINDDIRLLVQNGLPVQVQQALDAVRVIGNNAVHPGQIETDNPEMAGSLFVLVNLVTDYMISKPNEVSEIYGALPKGAIEAIEKRDAKT
ncbi:DUF4145 domain-containing protein [Pokkaliibacter plantistimulans]|uniref:DUF4145 domain-containing protein n=1 Tax=Pokkaliibacter plantistimulans TaxID=1635171 RepID=UPI000D743B6E|nr:DUF4145 domain-containing protein [Pokkaliibacter plantistimulans]